MSKHSQARRERRLAQGRRSGRFRPSLEVLEDRVCPTFLTVNTLSDPASPVANDGSLRGELLQNQADGGGDTIVFAPGLNGTINLLAANGRFANFGKSVTIDNLNSDTIAISGQGADGELVLTGGTVNITGTSVLGAGSLTFTGGGGIGNGGGIVALTGSTVTLNNVTVSGNTVAANSDNRAEGGGIYNSGTLTLNNCTVSYNAAQSQFSSEAEGGGIWNNGNLTINGGSVSYNTASNSLVASAYGGGIYNSGSLSIPGQFGTVTTISGNKASAGGEAWGGGIYSGFNSFASIYNASIVNNYAISTGPVGNASGGGIFAGGTSFLWDSTVWNNTVSSLHGTAIGGGITVNGGSLAAINDTVWLNTASGSAAAQPLGGGIAIISSGGELNLTFVTVGDNKADSGGAGNDEGGGIYISSGNTVYLENVLLSDPNGALTGPDVYGPITSASFCVAGSEAGTTFTIPPVQGVAGYVVQPNINSQLLFGTGPIPPTPTAELLGTPATDDAIGNGASLSWVSTDQRGDPRPSLNGDTDIGAYQTEPPTPPPTPGMLPPPPQRTPQITGLHVSESFGLLDQTETVSGTLSGGVPVGTAVTVTDNGVSQTTHTTDASGDFSAVFTWSLGQEFTTYAPHTITVSFGGTTVGGTNFGSNSGSTSAPNDLFSFWFQLLLLEDLLSALGM